MENAVKQGLHIHWIRKKVIDAFAQAIKEMA